MTIDFYMMDASAPCRAVLLTAKYLGLSLNKKLINLFTGEQLKPEFKKINPQHCVPTIVDGDLILWESRVIMTYLVNQYAPESDLYPKDPKRRAIIDRLLYFDIGTVFKSIEGAMFGHGLYGTKREPEKEVILRSTFKTIEEMLEKPPYAAGDKLSLADISMIATLSNAHLLADVMEFDFSPYPKIHAWEERVKDQLPQYKEITEPGEAQLRGFIATVKRQ